MVLLLVHLQRAMWLKLKGGPNLPGKQPKKGADRSAFDTATLKLHRFLDTVQVEGLGVKDCAFLL
jgi:hypothetical protein